MKKNDDAPFLNRASGTFSETSREWVLSADQWSQTYFQFRDGKLYLVENDNKEQQCVERELDITAFVLQHATSTSDPYPAIVSFLRSRRG